MNYSGKIIPAADIYESKDSFTIVLDIPGTVKENIDISIEDDNLTIKAKAVELDKEWQIAGSETAPVEYERVFTIGNKVSRDTVDAKYERGVLTLTLAKVEAAKPKKIDVKAA